MLVGVTVNSKKKNSSDFCPNDVQEFCIWSNVQVKFTHWCKEHDLYYLVVSKNCNLGNKK
jgi:hypothetical protein